MKIINLFIIVVLFIGCAGTKRSYEETYTQYDSEGNIESVTSYKFKDSTTAAPFGKVDETASSFAWQWDKDKSLKFGNATKGIDNTNQLDALVGFMKELNSFASTKTNETIKIKELENSQNEQHEH